MHKQVLITGSTRNIGFETARVFAGEGYDVHLTGRREEDALAAARRIEAEFPQIKACGYACDIARYDSIVHLFRELRQRTDALDVFIANAGHLGIGFDIFNTDEKDFDDIVDTNIKGSFFSCQEAGRLLGVRGGSIVLVSSVQSLGAVEGRTVYGMTKGALNVLGQYLACDFAPLHIRVNTALVGAVHSDRWDQMETDTQERIRKRYPLGREASLSEIARGIFSLAVEQTASTGSVLTIDSGLSASLLPFNERKNERHIRYMQED